MDTRTFRYNTPQEGVVFVFGSNTHGRHGRGAARDALTHYDAIIGLGEGPTKYTYALPTCKWTPHLVPMELEEIQEAVEQFRAYVVEHPELAFQLTPVGCGLAGYHHKQIAPMFEDFPSNCWLPEEWMSYLGMERSYWRSKWKRRFLP